MCLPMAKETQAIFVHDKLMSMESLFVVAAAINSMEKRINYKHPDCWVLDSFSVSCSTFRISAVLRFDRQQAGLGQVVQISRVLVDNESRKSMRLVIPQLESGS